MIGLFQENGPCGVDPNGSVFNNPYSWSNASNMIFIVSHTCPLYCLYSEYSCVRIIRLRSGFHTLCQLLATSQRKGLLHSCQTEAVQQTKLGHVAHSHFRWPKTQSTLLQAPPQASGRHYRALWEHFLNTLAKASTLRPSLMVVITEACSPSTLKSKMRNILVMKSISKVS